jgi:hypothetical protein
MMMMLRRANPLQGLHRLDSAMYGAAQTVGQNCRLQRAQCRAGTWGTLCWPAHVHACFGSHPNPAQAASQHSPWPGPHLRRPSGNSSATEMPTTT